MEKLNDEALDLLFREARAHNVWLDRTVSLNFHARKCDNKNAILARPTPSCAH